MESFNPNFIIRPVHTLVFWKSKRLWYFYFAQNVPKNFLERELAISMKREVSVGWPFPIHFHPWKKLSFTELCEIINQYMIGTM